MVKVEAITIVKLRGIRSLTLKPARKNLVIHGLNGSGKSGVVDAIQFGLTGKISRLAGRGTGRLSFQHHGPHVDSRDDPAAAEVFLTLYFPSLDKTIVLKRNAKTAATFALDPDDADARTIVEDMARRPELVMSRREIIKYILVEAGERAKGIQALLKLEEIDVLRRALLTARNQANNSHVEKRNLKDNAVDALLRHLGLSAMSDAAILDIVNEQRRILELPGITGLGDNTALDAGIEQGDRRATFNKVTAIRDMEALREVQRQFEGPDVRTKVTAILGAIATLEGDPDLLEVLRQRVLVERGLDLIDGSQCPLCDKMWENEAELRTHLQNKIAKSKQAEDIERKILDNAKPLARYVQQIIARIAPVKVLARSDGPEGFADRLSDWTDDLAAFAKKLTSAEGVLGQRARLERDWQAAPSSLAKDSATLAATTSDKPDQSTTAAAYSFLVLAQDRFASYRKAIQAEKCARDTADIGKLVYETYCKVSKDRLTVLYATVQNDFSNYYRELNADDEGGFQAKLEPTEGKLNLDVAFYDRGMFPPAAYHSEGHQDGMGVCLYLALMKQLMGGRFSFAVLDDVVMSIDLQHRKQICRLLLNHFRDTQFIITTHDKVWAKQMGQEGLVSSGNSIVFRGWSVQTGPVFEQESGVWSQLNDDLLKGDIEAAAARLRRHLEYIFADLADGLGAYVPYRSDFTYDLGVLSSAVIKRHKDLLGHAAKSAASWKNDTAGQEVQGLQAARKKALTKHNQEGWLVNKAVHYNEWADFSANEFHDVVEAYRELLQQLRCTAGQCKSLLYVTPMSQNPETLRCRCMEVNLNLKRK